MISARLGPIPVILLREPKLNCETSEYSLRICAAEARKRSAISRLERRTPFTAQTAAAAVAEVATMRSMCAGPDLRRRAGNPLLDVLLHTRQFARVRRIAFQKHLSEPDRAQGFGERVHHASVLAQDQFRAAPADVRDQQAPLRLRPASLHAQVNQARFLQAGDHFHRRSQDLRRARQKLGAIGGVSKRGSAHRADRQNIQLAILPGHHGQHLARQIHRPGLSLPSRNTFSPRRTTLREEASSRNCCSWSTSAVSMRMELLPISMAAYRGMELEVFACNTPFT